MGIFYYGSSHANIGFDEFLMKCPCCEAHSFASVLVKSNYYHIYFIPVFAYGKEADIICQKCGLKRYGIPFERRLFSDFDEVKKKFKHPWYTFSLTIAAGLLILLAAILG